MVQLCKWILSSPVCSEVLLLLCRVLNIISHIPLMWAGESVRTSFSKVDVSPPTSLYSIAKTSIYLARQAFEKAFWRDYPKGKAWGVPPLYRQMRKLCCTYFRNILQIHWKKTASWKPLEERLTMICSEVQSTELFCSVIS